VAPQGFIHNSVFERSIFYSIDHREAWWLNLFYTPPISGGFSKWGYQLGVDNPIGEDTVTVSHLTIRALTISNQLKPRRKLTIQTTGAIPRESVSREAVSGQSDREIKR